MKLFTLLIVTSIFLPTTLMGKSAPHVVDDDKVSIWRSNGYEPSELELFLKQLQSSILEEDAASVSRLVRYPLKINLSVKKKKKTYIKEVFINSPDIFVKNFGVLFKTKDKKKILSQKYEDLFVNYQGVNIWGGIWASKEFTSKKGEEDKILIYVLNRDDIKEGDLTNQ